jgi:hypothetical protein
VRALQISTLRIRAPVSSDGREIFYRLREFSRP